MKYFYIVCSICINIVVYAQITNTSNTVGLLYSEPKSVSDGYLLYAPIRSPHAYLIDNCGLVVNKWTFSNPTTYAGCYLQEDGSVIKLLPVSLDQYYGGINCIERRSWENELIWRYCHDSSNYFHSDIHLLPNGNILVISLEYFKIEEAILAGVNPALISNFGLEKILELKPIGTDSAAVVWEWRLWDHLIQDCDESKPNYGIIKEHPRRYNPELATDFSHFNSIDYNEELDQIIFSSWDDSEIFIIDHSTTTEEATSSAGGKYGFGGDFLFRWGNASNFDMEKDQRLVGQHNPRWIPKKFNRFGGMISVFNNRYGELIGDRRKSGVVIIDPDPDGDGVYEIGEKETFLPETYTYVWAGKSIRNDNIFSETMSGAVVQSNGNIVICEAEKGRFIEVDTSGAIVWVYNSPDAGFLQYTDSLTTIANQGDQLGSQVYKVEKYLADYPGFAGKQLCGKATLESENTLVEACINFWKPNMAYLHSLDGAAVKFNSISKNPGNVMWDFGDGQTSNEEAPTHIYSQPGIYKACLTGNNCYGFSTFCDTIETTVTDIPHFVNDNFSTFPNPVKNLLNFSKNLTNQTITIYNAQGIQQKTIQLKNQKSINLQFLASGIYFIKFDLNLKQESIITKIYKT